MEPFARVPESLVYSGASDRAVRLYCILARHADSSGEATPSRARLAELAHCSIRSIIRATEELVSADAVTVSERIRSNGSTTSNVYLLAAQTGVSPVSPPHATAVTPPVTPVSPPEREPRERSTEGNEFPSGAQSLVAFFVDESRRLGSNPPRAVTGRIAKQIGDLVGEGQPAANIRAGVRILLAKRLNPALLASCVHEASLNGNAEAPSGYNRGTYALLPIAE